MTKIKTDKKAPSQKWYLVDAENVVLGRLAARLAMILSGKHKSSYSRHLDAGDHVIVINARKVKLTGRKASDKKLKFFSGYPSGLREVSLGRLLRERPQYPLMHAVKGMLPKNSLGHKMLTKLRVYPDVDHPHKAQKPKELKLS